MDEIREKLTELDTKRNPIQKEIQAKKVEVDAFEADRKEKMGSMTDFINQKQAIKAEIDAEYDKLKKLRADNKTVKQQMSGGAYDMVVVMDILCFNFLNPMFHLYHPSTPYIHPSHYTGQG